MESNWEVILRFSAAVLPAVALHLMLGLADGRLATTVRRNTVLAGYVTQPWSDSPCSPIVSTRRVAARPALARRTGIGVTPPTCATSRRARRSAGASSGSVGG